jgi:prepilin-type N-terminal cleavage/methylation domain-containing protein
MTRLRLLVARRRPGFTLVELIVACAVVSVALLGVYTVFLQASGLERRMADQWVSGGAARAVATHLADVMERAVSVADSPTVRSDADASGPYIILRTQDGAAGMTLRRYQWAPAPEDGIGTWLRVKAQPYAGGHPVGLSQVESEESPWDHVEETVVARDLDAMSIEFRPVTNVGDWSPSYSEPGPIAVRIRVRVGDESTERVVITPAQASILGGEGEGE